MKKATKREQDLKIQQWYLRLSVIFALITLFLLALTINNFHQFSRLPLSEEKTVQKNYTFAEFEKDDRRYLVYVAEEQQPLEIASVTMHPALFDALKELGEGMRFPACFCRETPPVLLMRSWRSREKRALC